MGDRPVNLGKGQRPRALKLHPQAVRVQGTGSPQFTGQMGSWNTGLEPDVAS